jgi:RimJ/RimL family protein N-acetyltransferase
MVIRLLTPSDAVPYHTLRLRMLAAHPDAFTSSLDEESAKPLAWVEDRLAARDFPPAKFVLGACSDDGVLLGSVGLAVEERHKERHKALLFGMFTDTPARGRGVGRALLAACVERARSIAGLEQVNLSVTEGNPAEALYASVGFRRFGVEPRAVRWDGRYYGKVHMVLRLAP